MTKRTPQQINHYLNTHYPNRAERRAFEKKYKKQQQAIKSGKLKPKPFKIIKLSWWKRILKFLMRK